MLDAAPNRFDGPIAFCHGASRDGVVLHREGRYAEAVVVFEEPTLAYRLGFALGVQLFVERPEGPTLFQLRGRSIGRDPLLWTASASGGLAPRESPREAILADAAEELGLGEDDLPGLRPVAVSLSDDKGSAPRWPSCTGRASRRPCTRRSLPTRSPPGRRWTDGGSSGRPRRRRNPRGHPEPPPAFERTASARPCGATIVPSGRQGETGVREPIRGVSRSAVVPAL